MDFLISLKSNLPEVYIGTANMDYKMWELLTLLAKDEMYQSYYLVDEDQSPDRFKLNKLSSNLEDIVLFKKEYPCAYLLKFRSMLLDKEEHYDV